MLADVPQIPFVTAWTGEQTFWIDRLANGEPGLMQSQCPGDGKPMFSYRNVMQVRRVFDEGLCSICGKALGGSPVLFPMGEWQGPLFVFGDTPVHGDCAADSLSRCPHLKANRAVALPAPGYLESRVIRAEHDGQICVYGYAYVMDAAAFEKWAQA